MWYNKKELVLYAQEQKIPNYSQLTRSELESWITEWESYTTFEREAYAVPLRFLKYYAVEEFGLRGVQHYTKKNKIDLIRRILNE